MSDSPKTNLLLVDRFTIIWLTLVSLLISAALGAVWVSGQDTIKARRPAYSEGETAQDFVYNAYVAHLQGNLVRLETMYAAETWAEMQGEEISWQEYGLYGGSNILGLRILDPVYGTDESKIQVAGYVVRREDPLGIQRIQVTTRLIPLERYAGGSWLLRKMLPRDWYWTGPEFPN